MASPNTTGVKILSAASAPALEAAINQFLSGDGSVDNPVKRLTQAPQFLYDGSSVFYALLVVTSVN